MTFYQQKTFTLADLQKNISTLEAKLNDPQLSVEEKNKITNLIATLKEKDVEARTHTKQDGSKSVPKTPMRHYKDTDGKKQFGFVSKDSVDITLDRKTNLEMKELLGEKTISSQPQPEPDISQPLPPKAKKDDNSPQTKKSSRFSLTSIFTNAVILVAGFATGYVLKNAAYAGAAALAGMATSPALAIGLVVVAGAATKWSVDRFIRKKRGKDLHKSVVLGAVFGGVGALIGGLIPDEYIESATNYVFNLFNQGEDITAMTSAPTIEMPEPDAETTSSAFPESGSPTTDDITAVTTAPRMETPEPIEVAPSVAASPSAPEIHDAGPLTHGVHTSAEFRDVAQFAQSSEPRVNIAIDLLIDPVVDTDTALPITPDEASIPNTEPLPTMPAGFEAVSVQSGDTLSDLLAERGIFVYGGDYAEAGALESVWDYIDTLNPNVDLSNPDFILAGSRLTLPTSPEMLDAFMTGDMDAMASAQPLSPPLP